MGVLLRFALHEMAGTRLSADERRTMATRIISHAVGSDRANGLFLHAAMRSLFPVMDELRLARVPVFLPRPPTGLCAKLTCRG